MNPTQREAGRSDALDGRPATTTGASSTAPAGGLTGVIFPAASAFLGCLLALPTPSPAQDPGSRADLPTLRAARLRGSVSVDGRLDESAWRNAPAATDFVQGVPEEGAPPARPTEVRVLYDGDNLYVGARMFDDPGRVQDQLVRRDEEGNYDYLEVSFDPNLDRQTAFVFRIGASGVERDAFLFRDTREDEDWDAVWESAVHRDSAGWTAELRIPLSQIRFEGTRGAQTWGVNFRRRRLASNSVSFFSLVSRTEEGRVSQFGRLEGVHLPGSHHLFEIEPYAVSQLFRGTPGADNVLTDRTRFDPRAGLDLSYGLTPQFTVDATVNPDFGQVEVDPAVINLTAFETFFPEKRPFFVQDAQVFDFDLSGRRSTLFFSRRIGREPQGQAPDEAEVTDVPDRTTILGASKVTGRTVGGLSMGALAAVTSKETGRGYLPGPDSVTRFTAEPLTGYGVLRLQQDFRDGASRVGAIVTGMERDLPAGGSLDWLPSTALSWGADLDHSWGGPRSRRWNLSGHFAGSYVEGSPEAILEIQTNSQHFFQRPDAEGLEVDSTATSMTGFDWMLEFQRQSAEHWTWRVWTAEISPGFAANEMGFNTQGDQVEGGGFVQYQDITPGEIFRNWEVSMFTFHEFRHTLLDDVFDADQWSRAYKSGGFFLNAEGEFHNNWDLDLGMNVEPSSLSDTETRGGPLMVEPSELSWELRVNTDRRKPLSLGPELSYQTIGRSDGSSLRLGLDMNWRPSPSWEIALEPSVTVEDDPSQFVTSTDAVPYEPTFGTRYLFSDLDRTEFSMETRLNVAFTPKLSLDLFAQPLLSAVEFVSLKQLAEPASFRFDRFPEGSAVQPVPGEPDVVECVGGRTCVADGERHVDFDGDGRADFSFPQQDFNFRSLRGNAVLRWEYMPGSTLFLVWQHDRREEREFGDFDFSRDVGGLFDAPGENTLILKLSHFLNL